MNELSCGLVVTASVCELGLQEGPLGPGQGGVTDEPVEQILVVGTDQPLHHQGVPVREGPRPGRSIAFR